MRARTHRHPRSAALTAFTWTFAVALSGLAADVRADEIQDLTATAERAVATTVEAAIAVAAFDPGDALADIDAARSDIAAAQAQIEQQATADALGKRRRAALRRLTKFDGRLVAARASIEAGDEGDAREVKRLRKASRSGNAVLRLLHRYPALGFSLSEKGRRKAGYHKAGRNVTLRVRPGVHADGSPCVDAPVVSVDVVTPGTGLESVLPDVEDIGGGLHRITLTDDLGGVRVSATGCGVTRNWVLLNLGGKGVLDVDPPRNLRYALGFVSARTGVDAVVNTPLLEGDATGFTVEPALPAGLALDASLGSIRGAPTTETERATYTVTARNARGVAAGTVDYRVIPGLPAGVLELEDGFVAEVFQTGLEMPVKVAQAPDGRIFFNELKTGNTRVIGADGNLVPEPFATLDVRTGQERGLLGIALAPDFETSGHVFVFASRPADGQKPDRNQVLRYTANGDVGTDPTVILDDLPIGIIGNAGDLQFGPDGKLYVSLGDTGTFGTSQDDATLAGRILRIEPDGSVPTDNPDPASPEWCRGLRNSFDMTFHPTTGGLFATENGPTADDELNFIQKNKNYEWAAVPESIPGPLIGPRIQSWTPVIVPTGIVFHSGTGFGAEYEDDLFLLGYDHGEVRRVQLSGSAFTDLDAELPFARFDTEDATDHKPLDVIETADGALIVSTFTGMWRIRRFEP